MANGSIKDIGMYGSNTTAPMEQSVREMIDSLSDAENAEYDLYVRMGSDAIALTRAAVFAVKAAVSALSNAIKGARVMMATTATAATGVGAVVGGAASVGIATKVWRSIVKGKKNVVRVFRRSMSLLEAYQKWNEATERTDAMRDSCLHMEEQLLAAMLDSAEFSNKVLACRKRIVDHKHAVVKFYGMLVAAGVIPMAHRIPDGCETHDDDKLKTFNLVRQALRFIGEGEEPPAPEYMAMMRYVVEEHVHSNRHHPEYWTGCTVNETRQDASRMPLKYIAEMCADWAAMSEEMGTSLIDWMDKVVDHRWIFTDKQKALIEKCCKILAPKTAGGKRNYGYKYYDPGANKAAENDTVKTESLNNGGNAVMEAGNVSRQDILGAIHVLLNLIGDNGGLEALKDAEEPEQPEVAEAEIIDEPYGDSGVSRTVEEESDMTRILDEMDVPDCVHDMAPQLLNNVMPCQDGSFQSIDGSVHLDDREALFSMIGATLKAISKVMAGGTHASVSFDDSLRARVTARDQFGHRREITVDPVCTEGYHE